MSALAVTMPRVVASEWIKFRSLRSTIITLLVGMVLVIAFGLLISSVSSSGTVDGPPGGGASSDPTGISLSGVTLAALAVAVLGVLSTAGEYSTGSIRATLSAVPTRLPVLWAKAIVYAAVTFVLMLVAVTVAFLAGQAILSANGHAHAALFDSGVPRAIVGAAVYLTGAGLIGLAIGALLRNTAGAITAAVGTFFVVPVLSQLLPSSWKDTISPYLPSNAGSSFMTVHTSSGSLSPWAGLAVYAGYVAVLLAGAAILLKRRDA